MGSLEPDTEDVGHESFSKVHCSGCAGGVYSRAATYTAHTTTATDSMGATDGMIRKTYKNTVSPTPLSYNYSLLYYSATSSIYAQFAVSAPIYVGVFVRAPTGGIFVLKETSENVMPPLLFRDFKLCVVFASVRHTQN